MKPPINPTVSVVVCCHNAASRLKPTLARLAVQELAHPVSWEVIVVDNASTDGTATVAAESWNSNVPFKVVREPRLGLSNARNRALRESKGELICFIDDDTRPADHWLKELCGIASTHAADAFAGNVILPPALCRPWMTALHRSRLASTERLSRERPAQMFGANMAFFRHVLERVPQFDPELGNGALGFGEDSLFSLQLLQAGYRILFAERAIVEHFFEPGRLARPNWLRMARNKGRSRAYIEYHWNHEILERVMRRFLRSMVDLAHWRIGHLRDWIFPEGCSDSEMQLVQASSYLQQFRREMRRKRNYQIRGLVRIY
jgi:glycosyltransferase involved in cell wall biosynthesis